MVCMPVGFSREAAVESLHDAILEAGLTPRQNRELEDCIRGRFTVSGGGGGAGVGVDAVGWGVVVCDWSGMCSSANSVV